jgi:hypothetical protein
MDVLLMKKRALVDDTINGEKQVKKEFVQLSKTGAH